MFQINQEEDFDFDLEDVPLETSLAPFSGFSCLTPKLQLSQCKENVINNNEENIASTSSILKLPESKVKLDLVSTILNKKMSTWTSQAKTPPIHTGGSNMSLSGVEQVSGLNTACSDNLAMFDRKQAINSVACVRKFPGPAGLLENVINQRESTALKRKQHSFELNSDCLNSWTDSLDAFNISKFWNEAEMNLVKIKNSYSTNSSTFLKVPMLVLALKSIHFSSADASCILQDPTGEARGTIHEQVVEEYGKKLKHGTIFLLRRPAILIPSSVSFFVTITKTCLMAVYCPHEEPHVTLCRKYSQDDVQKWTLEKAEYADPLETLAEPAQRLTTYNPATTLNAPSIHPPQPKKPMPSAVTTNTKRACSPAQRQVGQQVPSNKATSGKPEPTKGTVHQAGSSKTSKQVEETFLEQFLDGIDTDALFDDF